MVSNKSKIINYGVSSTKTRRNFTITKDLLEFLKEKAINETHKTGKKVTITDLVVGSVYERFPDAPPDPDRKK